jgi:hypothetical protein
MYPLVWKYNSIYNHVPSVIYSSVAENFYKVKRQIKFFTANDYVGFS